MERVKKGEKYWFINSFGEVVSTTESGVIDDARRFAVGNYSHTEEEAEPMAHKLRAVLKGADVIEMPREEEIGKYYAEMMINNPDYHLHTSANVYINVVDWLKSKIVK